MIHSIILCISSFPLPSQSIPSMIHSIILCILLPAPSSSLLLLSISIPSMIHSHNSMYIFLPCPHYINPFHDSLHHSMYFFLPSPLYINPFHDSLHHSMYISPCPLLFLISPLSPCPLFVLHSPLYINPFRDSLHHSMYTTPCPLLPISIPSVIHSIILCISLPAPPLPSRSPLYQSLP